MLIRKPVNQIFKAFIDPEITVHFFNLPRIIKSYNNDLK